ncbi:hypothetical protein BB560_003706 [Smittium megazygosporum]|uniref:Nucleolar GTP-binding protein 2 n=1 Tax=Smittium megazygosporum TaxID=133381 RepID=A0A2T9ZB94_9FUNG|nr:hypothetical protein BB560_003706 [Smittium megazygosporum]
MGKKVQQQKVPGNLRLKGENFYHDRKKVAYLNMLKSGRAVRDRKGKIVKAAAFQSSEAKPARILPNRRWFGNTRVIGQQALADFREKLASKINDPYQVLLRANKLPMSLVTGATGPKGQTASDTFGANSANPNISTSSVLGKHNDEVVFGKPRIVDTAPFELTFGPRANRKKTALSSSHDSISQYAKAVSQAHSDYTPENDRNLVVSKDYLDEVKDWYFGAGTSKRIWNELYKVIDSSDVVIHVLDARNPLGTRCIHVENYLKKEAPHKHLIYVLNKVDLVPNWVTSRWVKYLSRERPTLAFHASVNNSFGKGTLIQLLRQFSKLHSDKKQISVGFIGYPNTGKSSIINTLRKKKVCSVAPLPGETKVWQYITLMRRIYLIDCPGIVQASSSDSQADIVLKGSIRTNLLNSPQDYIDEILYKRVKPEYVTRTYNIENWENTEDFLKLLAKSTGKLNKGGEPDLHVVSIMVLNDFMRGKLPHFVEPPNISSNNSASVHNGSLGKIKQNQKVEADKTNETTGASGPENDDDPQSDHSDVEEENSFLEEEKSKNTIFNLEQQFEKIPVSLEFFDHDLVLNNTLKSDANTTKPELSSKSKKKNKNEGGKSSSKSEAKSNSHEQMPDWDDVFENVVGDTVKFVPEDPRTFDEQCVNNENSESDSELDSDFENNDIQISNTSKGLEGDVTNKKRSKASAKLSNEKNSKSSSEPAAEDNSDSDSDSEQNTRKKQKGPRKTTSKAKPENFYTTHNVKNKNRLRKPKTGEPSSNDSTDVPINTGGGDARTSAIRKLRKPGKWKVSSK